MSLIGYGEEHDMKKQNLDAIAVDQSVSTMEGLGFEVLERLSCTQHPNHENVRRVELRLKAENGHRFRHIVEVVE